MFEHVAKRQGKRGRKATAAVVASVAAHLGVGTSLLIATLWQIDKLAPENTRPLQVGAAGMPAPSFQRPAPPPPLGGPKKTTTKIPKKRVKSLRQPALRIEKAPAPDTGGDGSGRADGRAHGLAGGIPGGTGTDPLGMGIGRGDGDGFGGGDVPYVPPPRVTKPTIVPPNLMAGHRISGDPHITPPEDVKVALLRAGTRQLLATVKMCIDTQGRVTNRSVLSSSGYPTYDAKLRREMKRWRYRPYKARGMAVPVCTAITFVYRMK